MGFACIANLTAHEPFSQAWLFLGSAKALPLVLFALEAWSTLTARLWSALHQLMNVQTQKNVIV